MAYSHSLVLLLALLSISLPVKVFAHIALWHPSMYGFNVTQDTFPYDNRPVAPLINLSFSKWWFHGHLEHPPHPEDRLQLPAGGSISVELACDKGVTKYFASNAGGDVRSTSQPNYPCPGSPTIQFHTLDENDARGCSLAIAQKSNVNEVQPEDFVVFSVNHKCVWTKDTQFDIPADMPACPPGGCTCAWFWIHGSDAGQQEMYMNGFQCDVTGSKIDAPALAKPQVARRCGADPANGISGDPGNCTIGAKQPLYWYQAERNNMFEGTFSPPLYNDLYNFKNGAQNDIFETSAKASDPSVAIAETSSPISVSPTSASSLEAPAATPVSTARTRSRNRIAKKFRSRPRGDLKDLV
ncbi:hypothetical protein B0H34DRAFT_801831 [Crassisporium funariophilum]|nr:hypothetical protein B0H34DRAFT_801831 [Crassisporium funariophilum]